MKINLLRQKILDLAIRGKLVPQDPNDEPASVLLERIRAEKERLIAEGKIKRPKKSNASSAPSHYRNQKQPFEIPESWQWVRLEDVAKIGTGATPSKSNMEYYGGNINWVSSSVTSFPYVDEPTDLITELALKETNCEIYPTGTLLMAMYGEGKTRGQVTELRIEAASNQACAAIIPYISTTKNFVKLYLLANYYQFRRLAEGGNQPNLNLGKISALFIPLPPIQEQQRIVKQYEFILESIELLEASKALLEGRINLLKSKILDLAMQGKLVPQDPSDEPAADMLRRINPKAKIISDNPHSWNIPSSWTWCYLGDIFQHNTGKALNSANKEGIEYEYITTSNVYWGRFVLDDLNKMPFKENEIGKCTTCKGDLLVCEGGDVGRAAIWNFDRNIMIQNHLHRLRPFDGDICTPLYYFVFRLYKDKGLIGGKGIALQGFSSKSLHKLIVPLPPANEETRIVAKIEELFSILDEIEASLQS